MKYNLQLEDKTPTPSVKYQFKYDVDTHGGAEMYTIIKPPIAGWKYDTVTKKYVVLMAAELTTASNAFEADQAKPFFQRKWKIGTNWVVTESPADDDIPPWPGPVPTL